MSKEEDDTPGFATYGTFFTVLESAFELERGDIDVAESLRLLLAFLSQHWQLLSFSKVLSSLRNDLDRL